MKAGLPDYSGYQRLPSWVLGFHGCDEEVAEKVLSSQSTNLTFSGNSWDWLGDGIYFWENDPIRALQFAQEGVAERVTKGKIKKPFVLGAIIDLGLCLNMFDQRALLEMKTAHESYVEVYQGEPMPVNSKKARYLDREIFEHLHSLRRIVELPAFDTVRAAFPEGAALYPGTEFTEQNHIQIAVRNSSLIRGYFRPRL